MKIGNDLCPRCNKEEVYSTLIASFDCYEHIMVCANCGWTSEDIEKNDVIVSSNKNEKTKEEK